MARPLIQKICSFCTKNYTTKINFCGRLCPNCASNGLVIKYHIKQKRDFLIQIYTEKTYVTYETDFNISKKNMKVGCLIGYISEITKNFFVGIIISRTSKSMMVQPTRRRYETIVNDTHSVPYKCVGCLFRLDI